jgi:hypothetical protein
MSNSLVARYVTPWKYRRAQEAARVAQLRERDGDDCRRCRRPMRFDLPHGHDSGPRIVQLVFAQHGEAGELHNQCLCHGRCNGVGADHTGEVQERRRRENEAKLFAKSRSRKRAAAAGQAGGVPAH